MKTSTTYDPEIKKAYVLVNGNEVASNDYNSSDGLEFEVGMTEDEKENYSNLMDNEKESWEEFIADNYDVSSEQTQR